MATVPYSEAPIGGWASHPEQGPSGKAGRASLQPGEYQGTQSQPANSVAPLCPWEASVRPIALKPWYILGEPQRPLWDGPRPLWGPERLNSHNWDIQVGLSLAVVGGESLFQPPGLGVHLSNTELG